MLRICVRCTAHALHAHVPPDALGSPVGLAGRFGLFVELFSLPVLALMGGEGLAGLALGLLVQRRLRQYGHNFTDSRVAEHETVLTFLS